MSQTRKRKLANNTYLNPHEDGTIGVRLHKTDVIVFHPDGSITLDSGGWRTVTTKDRMTRFLPSPWMVHSDKGVWYLCKGRPWMEDAVSTFAFADGITIQNGDVIGAGPIPLVTTRLRKRVREYAKAYIAAMVSGEVPMPGNGDCWFCLFGTPGTDHYLSHISEEERYYVPSLLAKAMERFPVSEAARGFVSDAWAGTDNGKWCEDVGKRQCEKSLRRYLYEKLGSAA